MSVLRWGSRALLLLLAAPHVTATTNLNSSINYCGRLVDQYQQDGTILFPARDAFLCLESVPFNATAALQFVDYYRQTLQFHSTLAYLKSPPPSYQQPGVDLLGGLDIIKDQIGSYVFDNQYSFEVAVLRLVYAAHDAHLTLAFGVSSVFSFGSPYLIKAASIDGRALPKVYLSDDLDQYSKDGLLPSAILTINEEPVNEYLEKYARLNSPGLLEAHASWNSLMSSPALDIQGGTSAFDLISPFYPGELLRITMENGTALPFVEFQAAAATFLFFDSIGPIANGQDFYNVFATVPGNNGQTDNSSDVDATSTSGSMTAAPTSTSEEPATPTDSSSPAPTDDPSATTTDDPSATTTDDGTACGAVASPTSWYQATCIEGYPGADVYQQNLGTTGYVTGYFIKEASLAVLSLPSFAASDDDLSAFSNTVGEFLTRSKAAGMRRVLVDLQGNAGGESLLAIDTFRHFFPNVEPFAGARQRAHSLENALGQTFSQYFQQYVDNATFGNDTYREALIDLPWAVQNYINGNTGRYFTGWGEYFGPIQEHGDTFNVLQRDNFSNPEFDTQATVSESDDSTESEQGLVVYGYANRTAVPPQPLYAAEDIALLTDGLCSSACSIFAEAMKSQGVRSVVVGGLPANGPMQAVSGSRGARVYESAELDADMAVALVLNSSLQAIIPQDRFDLNYSITSASLNLQDQVRRESMGPLQVAFEPANCRVFRTLKNFNNFSQLWQDAARALWDDPSLCVLDSVGWVKNVTDFQGPSDAQKLAWRYSQPANASSSLPFSPLLLNDSAIYDAPPRSPTLGHGARLPCGGRCVKPENCAQVVVCRTGQVKLQEMCVRSCDGGPFSCSVGLQTCVTTSRCDRQQCLPQRQGICLADVPSPDGCLAGQAREQTLRTARSISLTGRKSFTVQDLYAPSSERLRK